VPGTPDRAAAADVTGSRDLPAQRAITASVITQKLRRSPGSTATVSRAAPGEAAETVDIRSAVAPPSDHVPRDPGCRGGNRHQRRRARLGGAQCPVRVDRARVPACAAQRRSGHRTRRLPHRAPGVRTWNPGDEWSGADEVRGVAVGGSRTGTENFSGDVVEAEERGGQGRGRTNGSGRSTRPKRTLVEGRPVMRNRPGPTCGGSADGFGGAPRRRRHAQRGRGRGPAPRTQEHGSSTVMRRRGLFEGAVASISAPTALVTGGPSTMPPRSRKKNRAKRGGGRQKPQRIPPAKS